MFFFSSLVSLSILAFKVGFSGFKNDPIAAAVFQKLARLLMLMLLRLAWLLLESPIVYIEGMIGINEESKKKKGHRQNQLTTSHILSLVFKLDSICTTFESSSKV